MTEGCEASVERLAGPRPARSHSFFPPHLCCLLNLPSVPSRSLPSFVTSPLPSWSSASPLFMTLQPQACSVLRTVRPRSCARSGRGRSAFRGGARRRQAATARARRFAAMGRVEGWSQTARARVRARAGAGLLESAATAAGWCVAQSPPPPLLPAGTPSFSERVCSLPPSRLPSLTTTLLPPPPPAAPSLSDRLCSLAGPRCTFL